MLTNAQSSVAVGPHRVVTSVPFGIACSLAAVASLATFSALTGQISAGAAAGAAPEDLLIFDLRNGYTPEAVHATMQAWGPQGAQLYLLIEAIDVTFYHFGYRGAFLVFANWLADNLLTRSRDPVASGLLRQAGQAPSCCAAGLLAALFTAAPVIVAGVDFLEDALQVAMVLSHSSSAGGSLPWWTALVGSASAINVLKWTLVRSAVGVLGLEVVAVAYLAATSSPKPDSAPP